MKMDKGSHQDEELYGVQVGVCEDGCIEIRLVEDAETKISCYVDFQTGRRCLAPEDIPPMVAELREAKYNAEERS